MSAQAFAAILECLYSAAGTGEIVRLVYRGGSRPGMPRDVVVLLVNDGCVVCHEPPDTARKTYDLAKITAASVGDMVPLPRQSPLPASCSTLAEYGEAFRAEFEAAGWHVVVEEMRIGVGGFHKNGKPRKGCDIELRYTTPGRPRMVYDEETGERVMRSEVTGRERPYSVSGPEVSAAYQEMEPALLRFAEVVRSNVPRVG